MSEERSTSSRRPLPLRLLLGLLGAVVLVVVLVVYFLGVVMGQPQEDAANAVDMRQPLPMRSADRHILHENELQSLLADFPGTVLYAPQLSGYLLQRGTACDVDFEDGVARMIRLEYLTDNGQLIAVDSIYPARALSLLDYGSYRLVGEGIQVAGRRSVRMEDGQNIRLHCQTNTGLYAITVPAAARDQLSKLVQPLQLMHADEE